jgi:hypothetical protein
MSSCHRGGKGNNHAGYDEQVKRKGRTMKINMMVTVSELDGSRWVTVHYGTIDDLLQSYPRRHPVRGAIRHAVRNARREQRGVSVVSYDDQGENFTVRVVATAHSNDVAQTFVDGRR